MERFIKMNKKIVYIVIIALFFLVVWIYRTSYIEANNKIIFLEQNTVFVKNPLIVPDSTVCQNSSLFIIIVTSYVGHVELRSAHRRAMPADYLKSLNTSRIFLLARIPEKESLIRQESIYDESKVFGDILQGSFIENYRNLTYKHLMGLQWATTSCKKTKFILKVDDDTVFNIKGTYDFISSISSTEWENFLMGYILKNSKPKREKQNKWYVTWDEYPRNEYPPYLSGWYYIISPKIAKLLCQEAILHPYFWIDDIFITGLLTEALNIELKPLPRIFWLEYYELLECCLKDMIKKSIQCNYVVGPNGGRNNLIVEFNKALTICDNWKNCTIRNVDNSLKSSCVMFKDRTIFSDGQAEIHQIKLF